MESLARQASGTLASTAGRSVTCFRSCPLRHSSRRRGVACRASDAAGHSSPSSSSFPGGQQDWRAFRAHLVAWESASRRKADTQLMRPNYPPFVAGESWAHPLAEPEQGCLLLARQEHAGANGGSMHFFSGAVILITSHDDAHGTVGYVLNKPSPLLVDELQVLGAATGFKQAFGSQRLHLGGPVHLDHVTLLHRFVGIARSHKITEGIFMGGLPEAIRLVNSGIAQPSDFQLVLGMSGWAAGQLREEIRAGYWHVISASPDLVLPTAAESAASSSSSSCYSCSASSPSAAPSPSASSSSPASSSSASGAKPKAAPASSGSVATATAADAEAGPGKGRSSVSPMYRRIARLAVRGA